jgi:tyrosinase
MPRIRRDIATLGAGWNPTLLWYARAVTHLDALPPSDRTSWRYLGAMHGWDQGGWQQEGIISPGDPLPSQNEQLNLWDQCQHGGWYFLPWHRGYLAAFEDIVAQAVVDLGGPDDWALPYWNYLDSTNPTARDLPDAFVDATLPDGSPNPLSSPPRSGITALGPQPWVPRDITLAAMRVARYTSAQGAVGFGGGITAFLHFGGQTGAEESNPHNLVHVMLGGTGGGWMGDPNYAALDPIFWIHHCNVDRLWAAWLSQPGNIMENGANWRNGPFPRQFQTPDPAGNLNIFTPDETLPGGALAPTYDDLTAGTGIGAMPAALGGQAGQGIMPARASSAPPPSATLVGANAEAVTVGADAAATTVRIAPRETAAASALGEERLFLNLENVRGASPSGVLNIFVSLPATGAVPASAPEYVDTVALFGLAKASAQDGLHGGNGLNVAVDITDLARGLAQASEAELERLEVRVEQPGEDSANHPITVERISLYRQPVDSPSDPPVEADAG